MQEQELYKSKQAVAALSVASNAMLVVLKLIVGFLTGSVSVISEAIHSGIDLLAAVIAFFAVRTAHKPADKQHPFGHGKIENISGFIEAVLIFFAAGWIIFEAVKKIINPEPLEALGWGMAVMLFSSLVNMFVSERLFRTGRKTDSMALQADAWHLRVDVWTSAGVMTGLGLIWLGETVWKGMHFHWIDPVAAILVACLIIKAAYDLTHQSLQDLMDGSLTSQEEERVRNAILEYCPPISGFHRLRTRKSGANRFVEFHMLVEAKMTVDESHELTNRITKSIQTEQPTATVTIHIEPCNGFCSDVCLAGCLLPAKQQAQLHAQHLKVNQTPKSRKKT